MTIDLDIPIRDLKGRPMKWGGPDEREMTLGDALFYAVAESPHALTIADKRHRHRLAALFNGHGQVEISDADMAIVRQDYERFPILLVGALDAALGGPP